MRAFAASGVPIYPGQIARMSSPSEFGTSPFRAYDPGRGFGGLRGACGCSPGTGCGCASGLGAMGQSVSLDQIISNATSWLGGWAQSQLPSSAAVPPQYGSGGAIATQVMQWAPYIIGGYFLYKFLK